MLHQIAPRVRSLISKLTRGRLSAALALIVLVGILPSEWAAAAGSDFTVTFRGAHPASYSHLTGDGGVFSNVVTQLNGGDFDCGDRVVFLTRIAVDNNPTAANQTVQLNFTFGTQSTGQDGAGYRSLVLAAANTLDPAHTANGTFPSSVNVVTNNFPVNGDPAQVGVQITGLEANEVFILRLVLELGCDPFPASPTGNIQAALASAAVISPTPDAISGGQQTTPLMSAGEIGQPSIDITKTADAASVSAGDPIGFTIGVSNPGNGTATGVQVTDNLPGNGGLDWSINPAVTGCSITGTPPAEQLVCNFATLAAGASTPSIHVTSGTTPESCGTVSNTATVTTNNDGTDSAPATVNVQCPNVTVEKTANPSIITAGQTATFNILVRNDGPGIARDVTLTDTLPAGTWAENSAQCDIQAGVLGCDFGDMASGATASVTLTRSTDTCAELRNTAVVSATNEPQTALGNNSSTATITVTCARLSIAKTADDPSVSAGGQVGFVITVINGGNADATNVTFADPLPGNAGLNWSLAQPVTGCTIDGNVGAQVLNCTLPTVAANGGSVSIHVISPTEPGTCGTFTNTVTLGGGPVEASITVNCPDVTVTKTADADTINAGDLAAFTIVVGNNGPGTATGVTLRDTLPSGIDWSEDSDDCSITGTLLSCTFPGSLAPGATHTIHVTGRTDGADCGILSNTATVEATNEPAANGGNNSDGAQVTVNCPDVQVEKTADDPTINAGEPAAFTIVVTNNGPGTATSVTLNDTLPAGITWTEDSPFCTITGNVLTCDFGDMGVDESHTIHLTGTTDPADCGVLNNTSTIAATNEATGAGGNNSATASITVVCPPPPPGYGTDPNTLPEERPYDPAPGGEQAGDTGGTGGEQPSGDPGAGTAGTTVPVIAAPETGNPVVDAVINVVESQVTLPRTGGELIQQAMVGLGLIGLGLVLLAVRRRRSSTSA